MVPAQQPNDRSSLPSAKARKNETQSPTFDLEAEAVAAALDKAVEMLHWNDRQPIELRPNTTADPATSHPGGRTHCQYVGTDQTDD